MEAQLEYRAVLAVDIEKSSGRGNVALLRNRDALRSMLGEAFRRSGIDWEECVRDDLGDGLRVTAPAGTRKASLVHPLVQELSGLLVAHNGTADEATRIRVRVALHAGEVCLTPAGEVAGSPLEILARLLDAPPARAALAAAPRTVPVALLMSQHFYDETVRQGYEGIDPAAFHQVGFTVKELTADAWLHTPGWTPPQEPAHEPEQEPEQEAAVKERDRPRGDSKMVNKASRKGVIYATQNGDQHIRITG
jgi:class 3 adenylate cyclase